MYYNVLKFGVDLTVGSLIHIMIKWHTLMKLGPNNKISLIGCQIWNWVIKCSLEGSSGSSGHMPSQAAAGSLDSLKNSPNSKISQIIPK